MEKNYVYAPLLVESSDSDFGFVPVKAKLLNESQENDVKLFNVKFNIVNGKVMLDEENSLNFNEKINCLALINPELTSIVSYVTNSYEEALEYCSYSTQEFLALKYDLDKINMEDTFLDYINDLYDQASNVYYQESSIDFINSKMYDNTFVKNLHAKTMNDDMNFKKILNEEGENNMETKYVYAPLMVERLVKGTEARYIAFLPVRAEYISDENINDRFNIKNVKFLTTEDTIYLDDTKEIFLPSELTVPFNSDYVAVPQIFESYGEALTYCKNATEDILMSVIKLDGLEEYTAFYSEIHNLYNEIMNHYIADISVNQCSSDEVELKLSNLFTECLVALDINEKRLDEARKIRK